MPATRTTRRSPAARRATTSWSLKLTNSAIPRPKPAFFLMGAVHAREYSTAETVMRFAEQMAHSYGTDPDATWLLDNYELHVMPQANPDGRKVAEKGCYQRKNKNRSNGGYCADPPTAGNQYGTDLNRNSSFISADEGANDDPCEQMYHGPYADSEPETQAIQSYLTALFPRPARSARNGRRAVLRDRRGHVAPRVFRCDPLPLGLPHGGRAQR